MSERVLSYAALADKPLRAGMFAGGSALLALGSALGAAEGLIMRFGSLDGPAATVAFWTVPSLIGGTLNFAAVLAFLASKPAGTLTAAARRAVMVLAAVYLGLVVFSACEPLLYVMNVLPWPSLLTPRELQRGEALLDIASVSVLVALYGVGITYLRDVSRQLATPWVYHAGGTILRLRLITIALSGVQAVERLVNLGGPVTGNLVGDFATAASLLGMLAMTAYWSAAAIAVWRRRAVARA